MADLESVLADVSYLMAMERSKSPNAKTVKKLTLPDPRCAELTTRNKHTRAQRHPLFVVSYVR